MRRVARQFRSVIYITLSMLSMFGLVMNKLVYDGLYDRHYLFLDPRGGADDSSISIWDLKHGAELEDEFWLPPRRIELSKTWSEIGINTTSTLSSSLAPEANHYNPKKEDVRSKRRRSANIQLPNRPTERLQQMTKTSTTDSKVTHPQQGRLRRQRRQRKQARKQVTTSERPPKTKAETDVLRSSIRQNRRLPQYHFQADTGTGNEVWTEVEYHVPETPGAFLHVGKTGGSTLSSQLRNGCHSWIRKPCSSKPIQNESLVSKLTTYYHTPDFDKLANRSYEFYVVGVRDPFDRLLSTYAYQHPRNIRARNDTRRIPFFRHYVSMYSCFRTLEAFARGVGRKPMNFHYPNPMELNRTDCTNLARAVINQKVWLSNHFYWSINRIRALVFSSQLDEEDHKGSHENHPPIVFYVIRNENLWGDWVSTNEHLGQKNVSTAPEIRLRDHRDMKLPVSKQLSRAGRRNLCLALKPEYEAYLDILRRAVNLDDRERETSLKIANRNCPWLDLRF